ncbi:hypothetical protein MY04_5307 [Flammeovirga sp. MY04]|uniref:sensor histidine kinase n=1 Tax=Flammeovirga sp. MY04 TaxID=1191459 RepID=UPI000A06F3FD|nr:sensor histidine kinase [Flammeovirga sp. MY04]ANQ52639.2 hypothetical protein MY04_5307 [Flammeovirga sp. MY04]
MRHLSILFSIIFLMFISTTLANEHPSEKIDFTLIEDKAPLLTIKEASSALNTNQVQKRSHLSNEDCLWLLVTIPQNEVGKEMVFTSNNWGEILVYDASNLQLIGKNGNIYSYHDFFENNSVLLPSSTEKIIVQLIPHVSIYGGKALDFTLLPKEEYLLEKEERNYIHTLFIGVIIAMALYNFMIFLAIKDISYFYYVVNVVGSALYLLFFHRLSGKLLWADAAIWDIHSFTLIVPITGIARSFFTKEYLNLKKHLPLGNTFLNGITLLYIIPIVMGLISYFTDYDFLKQATVFIGLIGACILSSMLLFSFIVYRKGEKSAFYFFMANILFVCAAIILIMHEVSLLSDLPFTEYFTEVGLVAQVILFSFGLADRLKRSQQQLLNEVKEKERIKENMYLEKQLLISNQKVKLKEEVAARTRELAETVADLRTSEASLQKLNNLKDRLFSIISHDLRSPLATFDSYLNLLSQHYDKLTEEERKELTMDTNHTLQQFSILLENLLEWSTLQIKEGQVNKSLFDIDEIIVKNKELYSASFKKKSLQFDYKKTVQNTIVFADYKMIDFVIRNLLNNAYKFTSEKGKIEVMVKNHLQYTLVEVKDKGIGMSEDEIDKIKNKIYYTKLGTDGEKGIGIGLSLCASYLMIHDTSLKITSNNENGTSFSFYLPKTEY